MIAIIRLAPEAGAPETLPPFSGYIAAVWSSGFLQLAWCL